MLNEDLIYDNIELNKVAEPQQQQLIEFSSPSHLKLSDEEDNFQQHAQLSPEPDKEIKSAEYSIKSGYNYLFKKKKKPYEEDRTARALRKQDMFNSNELEGLPQINELKDQIN